MGRYLIQPSDTLAISYRYSPEYDFTGPVQPDGFISPPLLGEVMVAGLTLEQVRERVLEKARVRLREPEVFVVLKDFERRRSGRRRSRASRASSSCAAAPACSRPSRIAGGFKTSAKHSQVVLFRRYDEEHVITRVLNVKKLERDTDHAERRAEHRPAAGRLPDGAEEHVSARWSAFCRSSASGC